MKKVIISTTKKSFRLVIAGIAIVLTVSFGQAVQAQSILVSSPEAAKEEKSESGFRASIYPVINTLLMKVNFENPDRERITLIIENSEKKIVYKKDLGKVKVFMGNFDLAQIPDQAYTITIKGDTKTYFKSFTLLTQQERIVQAYSKPDIE